MTSRFISAVVLAALAFAAVPMELAAAQGRANVRPARVHHLRVTPLRPSRIRIQQVLVHETLVRPLRTPPVRVREVTARRIHARPAHVPAVRVRPVRTF